MRAETIPRFVPVEQRRGAQRIEHDLTRLPRRHRLLGQRPVVLGAGRLRARRGITIHPVGSGATAVAVRSSSRMLVSVIVAADSASEATGSAAIAGALAMKPTQPRARNASWAALRVEMISVRD
jgi:hypothetical protein